MTDQPKKPFTVRRVALAVLAAFMLAFAAAEGAGWPFLAGPIERGLSKALDRRVSLSATPDAAPLVRIHLLGGLRVNAPQIEIAAPAWSSAPHMLLARDAKLHVAYISLWRAYRGEVLRVRDLQAASLDLQLERQADGRASWQFGAAKPAPPDTSAVPTLPRFDHLQVSDGKLRLHDVPMVVDADGSFSLVEATEANDGRSGIGAPGLQLRAQGTYRKLPLKIDLRAAGLTPAMVSGAQAAPLPVSIDAHVGRAALVFKGTATDALNFAGLEGDYSMQGPSLAAVGDPVGITLPTTGPFKASGRIAKRGAVWNVVVAQAGIGSSRLSGAFTFDRTPTVPLLAGRLSGTRLAMADLGPAIGTRVPGSAPAGSAPASASASAPAGASANTTASSSGRVLPDRPFDLPSLRAMNANVLVDIDTVDLGSGRLEPLKPLRAHLVLADAVLVLRDIDARTGQGRLAGTVQLDGRSAAIALWNADVRWEGVRLESWIHQARANDAAPYVSGLLKGEARVAGQGKSTAAILGSLRGGVRAQVSNGTISHLLVEAAGLDLAQGLGVFIKGDDALPLQCLVADMVADQGVLRPRALVIDTRDSTLWLEGSVSLATEALELDAHVAPKDFSPFALRTPVHLRGTFSAPRVTLDAGRLGARVGAAALLGLINPIAALIPFIDTGSADEAQRGAAGCADLSRRIKAQPTLPAPPPARASAKAARR
jgi:AsmA family protein